MEIFGLTPEIFNLIQYPAMALTCSGYTFLVSTSALKRKTGFFISATGNVIWIIYGIITFQPALIGTNAYILALGIIGYLNNSHRADPDLVKYMKENDLI